TCPPVGGHVGGSPWPATARKNPESGLAPPSHRGHRVEYKRRVAANKRGTISPAHRLPLLSRLASPPELHSSASSRIPLGVSNRFAHIGYVALDARTDL